MRYRVDTRSLSRYDMSRFRYKKEEEQMAKDSSVGYSSGKFSLLMGGYYALQVLCLSYLAEFLISFGYAEGFIGIVLTAESISSMATMLLFGYLTDKYSNPKLLIVLVVSVYTALQVLLFFFSASKAFIIIFALFGLGTLISAAGIVDSWVIKAQEQDPSLDYSKIRSVGSITFGVVSLLTGIMISRFSHRSAIFIAIIGAVMIILPALRLRNPVIGGSEGSVSIVEGSKVLFRNRGFMLIVLCCFIFSLSDLSFANYYAVMMNSVGGTTTQLGIGLFVMCVAEFAAMYFLSDIAKKISLRKIMAFGLLGFFLRSFISSFAKTPLSLILVTILQAISFAIAIPACTMLISEIIEFRYQATAIQLFQMAIVTGSMIFNTPIGFIAEKYGIMHMIRLASLGALTSFVIFVVFSKKLIPDSRA